MPEKTIDIYLVLHSEEGLANIAAVQENVNELSSALQRLVKDTETAGTTLTSIFKGSADTLKQKIREMKDANAQAAMDVASTKEKPIFPFSDEEISAMEAKLRALGQAYQVVKDQLKAGRSEAKEYAASTDVVGKAAQEAAIKERLLTDQIKEQYREQARGTNITPKEFTSQFVAQFKETPIEGIAVESAMRAASTATQELQKEDKDAATAVEMLNKNMKEQATTAKTTSGAVQESAQSVGVFSSFVGNLGSVAALVFGGSIALIAANALRDIINFFKEATAAGIEFEKAIIRLKISTDLLRENGLNVSMKETLATVEKLNQDFPIFTRKSLAEGVSYVQLLSQNLGLSVEQMQNLERVSASLAIVMGTDFKDAAREVALFLSSGYGEALQRAGVLASMGEMRRELARMGVAEDYRDVDARTRALAGYNVVMRQASGLIDKAIVLQKDSAYQEDKLATAWGNFKNVIGEAVAPAFLNFANILASALDGLQDMFTKMVILDAYLRAGFTATMLGAAKAVMILGEMIIHVGRASYDSVGAFKQAVEEIKAIFESAKNASLEQNLPDLFGKFKESAVDTSKALAEQLDKITSAFEEMYKQVQKIQKDFMDESVALWQAYKDDIVKIDEDGYQKQAELAAKYTTDIANINLKADTDIIDSNTKYGRDVADTEHQFQIKRADAERKYRENELKAERDFQEKMRRLREDFILNLEDAVRERDAMQIIRLTRKYNLDRERLLRDGANEAEDRKRAYANETKDAEAQKNERLRQLKVELDRRVADINLSRQREILAREQQYAREKIDLQISLKQQRDARAAQYARDVEDLKKAQEKRLIEMAQGWADTYGVNEDGALKIYGLMTGIFGPSGTLDTLFSNYIYDIKKKSSDLVTQLMADTALMSQYFQGIQAQAQAYNPTQPGQHDPFATEQAPSPTNVYGLPPAVMELLHRLGVPGFAEGGSITVNKPTLAMFGERGMETATFTPSSSSGSSPFGRSNQMGGKVTVALDLSPDLEARITDNTLNEMAEVMLSVGGRSK